MVDLSTFPNDLNITIQELNKDLDFIILDRGSDESKIWWNEWKWFIVDDSNNMFITMPDQIVDFLNELWWNYEEIQLKNNI